MATRVEIARREYQTSSKINTWSAPHQHPDSRIPDPETRNQKPGIWTPDPGFRNPDSGTRIRVALTPKDPGSGFWNQNLPTARGWSADGRWSEDRIVSRCSSRLSDAENHLCILVCMVIYDSGQASLEHLLLSWYLSQSLSLQNKDRTSNNQ